MAQPKYSVIVPVYNRPQEVEELLASLTHQTFKDFEVILAEDGSSVTSEKIYEKYADQLSIRYFSKFNSGPGPSRNFGFEKASGNFLVVFDSDCVIPPNYFQSVEKFIQISPCDAWGGPDRASDDFTFLQRAMGYTMSSVLTTGGIRGAKKGLGWFQPRSFNMGMSRRVFEVTRGFRFDRYAEDIELSIRMKKSGFIVKLIPDAFVFHKRRTDFQQFYRQVFNFGRGRVQVGKVHPTEIKLVHWFPAFFTLGLISVPFLLVLELRLAAVAVAAYGIYLMAILLHSFLVSRSLRVAFLSVPAAVIQLVGYGLGFLRETVKTYIGKNPI